MENDCPKPTTPKENFQILKKYTLKSSLDNKKNYLLELGANNNEIKLKLNITNEFVQYIYENKYILDDLIKISKIFKLCNNVIELVTYLNENFENNIVILKEENSDLISLSFKMILPNNKEENFQLDFKKKNIRSQISLENLYKIINNIQNENKAKNIENEEMKNEINSLKNQINEKDTIINELKESFNKFVEDSKTQLKSISDSLIELNNLNNFLFNYSGISMIYEALKLKMPQIKEKKIELKLIYQASLDGQNWRNCHQKINKIEDTMSLVITKKGRKFGVFRHIGINGDGPWRIDNNAFIFSLDNHKIYNVKPNKAVIACDNSCFIQVMNTIVITDDLLNNSYKDYDMNQMNTYFEGFTKDYELSKEKNYCVEELEVYSFKFN